LIKIRHRLIDVKDGGKPTCFSGVRGGGEKGCRKKIEAMDRTTERKGPYGDNDLMTSLVVTENGIG